MQTSAVVFTEPENLELSPLTLTPPDEDDVVIEVEWSGISTGTERLLKAAGFGRVETVRNRLPLLTRVVVAHRIGGNCE